MPAIGFPPMAPGLHAHFVAMVGLRLLAHAGLSCELPPPTRKRSKTCRGTPMALRPQASRRSKQRVSKLRRTRRSAKQRYRPLLENLEPRMLLAGFWSTLQPTTPARGPVAGSQAVMLVSNGDVLAGQDTSPG